MLLAGFGLAWPEFHPAEVKLFCFVWESWTSLLVVVARVLLWGWLCLSPELVVVLPEFGFSCWPELIAVLTEFDSSCWLEHFWCGWSLFPFQE
ncbi:hypothetical protein Patl1_32404 [Pistacia atlantica]|uniref:Uncharacterized protein n=1 Tax=Pistacia atlantica TaxID=434234 RepID=A0ACC1AR76_9ROSI|nr:hypothetical protein Patl1_32404 [Pistacia atlantica]